MFGDCLMLFQLNFASEDKTEVYFLAVWIVGILMLNIIFFFVIVAVTNLLSQLLLETFEYGFNSTASN